MKPTRRDVLKLATLMGAAHVLGGCTMAAENNPADLILRNGRIATLDDRRSFVQGVAIQGPKTKQAVSTTAVGALGGAFWGMLFGLIFFVPLLGLALGAAS